ncbi:hypothetical protein IGI04_025535 [Brassica rapa subsp. trilocularis]|uniref:Uncharacterized protein n=1 Tax=Brassica rapa subsp. trilocularis TaxID=1813537 RepID=A0ABQ7KTB3_BRACM|nr:hypothetical protein IGI04_025535 [Brassica rapa subsp. trilocularis]
MDRTHRPTRRKGELDRTGRPTSQFGQLDREGHPTRPFGELDRASRQNCPFGELDQLACLHPVLVAPYFEIGSNLLLFHLDRSHRWNFTI